MLLKGIIIEDQHQDTLLYASTVKVNITDWFFVKKHIELKYIGLEDATIFLHRSDSIWNYQFLADYFAGSPSNKPKNAIHLNIRAIDLNRISLIQKDGWRGEDLTGSLGSMEMDAREIDFEKKLVDINSLVLKQPHFKVYQYEGNRPERILTDSAANQVASKKATSLIDELQWNPENWRVQVDQLAIKNGQFNHDRFTARTPYEWFDPLHIHFSSINGSLHNFKWEQDTISAQANLQLQERSGFIVNKLEADIHFHPKAMIFSHLDIITPKSRLRNYFAMEYNSFNDDMLKFEHNVQLTGNLQDANIHSDDIAYFAPELKSWAKKIKLNGQARGTIDNLKAKDFTIEAGQTTTLKGSFSIAGLPDIESAFIDFKANQLKTTAEDAMLIVPQLRAVKHPDLTAIEWMEFDGSFTGFIRDFVTYGNFRTNLGQLHTDMNMKLPADGPSSYSGKINARDFDLGAFMQIKNVGIISLTATLKGQGFNIKTLKADLDTEIKSIEVMDYAYQNIKAKGNFSKMVFNGAFEVKDPNLQFNLNGLVDLDKTTPKFDFDADITKADLHATGLFHEPLEMNGKLALNFEGNNIDNFLGDARVYNASVISNGKRLSFDSLLLSSKILGDHKTLVLNSNEIDVAIAGKFAIRDMPVAVQRFLYNYYPSYIKKPLRESIHEDFNFLVKTKNIEEYIALLNKNLTGFNNSTFRGRINSHENIFALDADVPLLGYKDILFSGITVTGNGDLEQLNLETNIDNIAVNDSFYFPETAIKINSKQDSSDISIRATANQTFNTGNISTRVITLSDGIRIQFHPSSFDINGKTWQIEKDGELLIRKKQLLASELKITQDLQSISIKTIADTSNTNNIIVQLNRINIGDFTPFFISTNRLEGLLQGTVQLKDPFGERLAEAALELNEFRLDNDSVGAVKLDANYTEKSGIINFIATANNPGYHFDISGAVNTSADSMQDAIDITAAVKNTRVNLLQQYLTDIFSKMEGEVTGNLRIKGSGNKLHYTGPVTIKDAVLKVDYTQVEYKVPFASFQFTDVGIDFGRFTLYDRFGDSAKASGNLSHQNFGKMAFNMQINTNRFELLNTGTTDNSMFYGQARGKASLTLTGPETDLRLQIKAEPTDSSHIIIPSSNSREGGTADFIVWKVYGREMNAGNPLRNQSNFNVNLEVVANNLLSIDMILDELTGDIIKATGRGNLAFQIGTRDKFTMNGRYEIDRGEYNFSFQTLVKKPFKLREGAGNFVEWNGDPYEANIKIDAEYVAENVRFSDLISTQNSALLGDANIRKYRGDVYVIAELRGELNSPDITFNFDFPTNMPFRNDLSFTQALELIKKDQQELTKQVTYLVVFNSFAPFSSNNVDVGASFIEGVVVNTLSGIFSNTLSKEFNSVLQKIFRDESLKVNISTNFYNGSNIILENSAVSGRSGLVIDRSNFNFSIGKSILNDRLTFNFGSELDFGLSTFQQAQLNFQFLPDINAEWKITPDGRIRATFFTRNSYDFYIGRQRNRSGASISIRKEFEKFKDLFKKQ